MREGRDDEIELARYRSYLRVLARASVGPEWERRFDASDLVQEALLQAHRKRDQIRGRDEAQVLAWLRRILERVLAHALRDHQRARRDLRREVPIAASLDESSARLEALLAGDGSTPSEKALQRERAVELSEALEALPGAQREAVVATYLSGQSLDETARAMGKTPGAVASLVRRGLARLRESLREES